MQQVQQRDAGERISWARALIFGVGFFFLATFLVGQLPSFVNGEMISASLVGFEQAMLSLGLVFLAAFLVIQVIVLLFDPKPVVPPVIIAGLGFIAALVGLIVMFWAAITNSQYLPTDTTNIASVLGGRFLWFPAGAVDMMAVGVFLIFVGMAWLFYGVLAMREQNDPDRRDLGMTRGVRTLLTVGTVMLVFFMLFFAFVSPDGLAKAISPSCPLAALNGCNWSTGLFWVNTIYNLFLGITVLCTLGAFALRMHYLMRPTRKNTMKGLYAVGVNLAPIALICLAAWFLIYPFVGWLHSLPGLGDYFTVCARKSAIPQSCAFAQAGGDLIGSILTVNGFVIMMAAVWAWKSHRNLVVIGSLAIAAVLAMATLFTHTNVDASAPYQGLVALMLAAGALIVTTIWTNVSRREFAVVGEKPLGCLGMWLLGGTAFFIYIASFAFFSIPGFRETETNIPFFPGALIGIRSATATKPALDAVVVVIIIAILAAIQFYFLVRNRYRV